jgi:RNA recognition motif-containing protein
MPGGFGGYPGGPNDNMQILQNLQNLNQGAPLLDQKNLVAKPNPYVIVETEAAVSKDGNETGKIAVFKYPKSKIFVGGLDFRLTNEELKQHFIQYGEIESAVILKDINTGQSRGFGFVTFKEEAVAIDLI